MKARAVFCRAVLSLTVVCTLAAFVVGCKKKDESVTESSGTGHKTAAEIQKSPYGDMLIYGTIGEPLNLVPAIASDSASHEAARFVYSSLLDVDKDLNIVGDLAGSWEISGDNLTITFYLRDDVLWHDGKPFTAADVLFTYEFMLDPNTPTPYDDDYRRVSSIEAPDDYTVKVTYDEPYSPALVSWAALWIMPKHLLDGIVVTKSPLQRNPVGTGPYRFESWEPNKSVTLVYNDSYYNGRPHLDKLQFRFFQDQSTMFLELLNGSIDMAGLTPAQFTMQTSNPRFQQQYNKFEYVSHSYNYVGYNLRREPFNDVRVRIALTYATPKQQIIDSVMQGLGQPTEGIYIPGSFWHNPDVVRYDYNPAIAQALLEEAGWVKDSSGRLMKDKKQLKITLITNQNNVRSQMAEILQQSWGELGINVSIRVLEWGNFLNEHVKKSNFDALILSWNIVLDPDPTTVWHSEGCRINNTMNFVCFQNSEADELMEKGVLTFEPDERKVYYDRFQEILAEEQPYTFLFVPNATIAVAKRFRGVEPAQAGIWHNFTEWYVATDEQKYKFAQ